MANIITFSISTEAPYTKAEKEELFDAFIAFAKGADDDVDVDSGELTITPEGESTEISDEKRQEIIAEFLDTSTYEVKLNITNGGIGFENTLK